MKILIAEDDAVSRTILRRAVEKFGHECLAAEDGEKAWELYKENPELDAIISDWMLPGMDGLELCRKVRGEKREWYTYFIFLTALGDREHLLMGLEAGADDYLSKPLDHDELQVRLISALRVTRLHRRLAFQKDELRESEERLRGLSDATFEGIAISEGGRIVETNRAFAEMFGYEPSEVVGMSARDFIAPESHEGVQQSISSGSEEPCEAVGLRKDGTKLDVEIRGRPSSYRGRVARITAVRDITERKTLEEHLRYQAFHDPLTGLPNRAMFMKHLSDSFIRAGWRASKVAVLFTDLDNLKVVNDSLGHETGDNLLIAVARRLEDCLRHEDIAARIGGDEFAILLVDVLRVDDALQIAECIVERLHVPFDFNGQRISASMSVGIAFSDSAQEQPTDLLRQADLALYRAKKAGKAHYEVFELGMDTDV